jgi:streptogramin lyase
VAALDGVDPQPLEGGVIARRARRLRRQKVGIAAVGAGIVAVVLALAVFGPADGPLGPPTVGATAQVTLPGEVVGSAAEGGHLWTLTCDTGCGGSPSESRAHGFLVEIDDETGQIVRTTPIENPGIIAAGEGFVWVASFPDGVLTRVDGQTGDVSGTLKLALPATSGFPDSEFLPNSIAIGGGSVWVATERGYVAQVDAERIRLTRVVHVPYPVGGIAFGEGRLWCSGGLLGLGHIDAGSGAASEPIAIEDRAGRTLSADDLTVSGGSVWVRGGWVPPEKETSDPGAEAVLGLAQVALGSSEVIRTVNFDQYLSVRAMSNSRLWLSRRDSAQGSADVFELDLTSPANVRLAARLAEPGTIIGAVGDSLWVARPGGVTARYEIPSGS